LLNELVTRFLLLLVLELDLFHEFDLQFEVNRGQAVDWGLNLLRRVRLLIFRSERVGLGFFRMSNGTGLG